MLTTQPQIDTAAIRKQINSLILTFNEEAVRQHILNVINRLPDGQENQNIIMLLSNLKRMYVRDPGNRPGEEEFDRVLEEINKIVTTAENFVKEAKRQEEFDRKKEENRKKEAEAKARRKEEADRIAALQPIQPVALIETPVINAGASYPPPPPPPPLKGRLPLMATSSSIPMPPPPPPPPVSGRVGVQPRVVHPQVVVPATPTPSEGEGNFAVPKVRRPQGAPSNDELIEQIRLSTERRRIAAEQEEARRLANAPDLNTAERVAYRAEKEAKEEAERKKAADPAEQAAKKEKEAAEQAAKAAFQAFLSTNMAKRRAITARPADTDDDSSDEDASPRQLVQLRPVVQPSMTPAPAAVATPTSSRVPAPMVVPTTPATSATQQAAPIQQEPAVLRANVNGKGRKIDGANNDEDSSDDDAAPLRPLVQLRPVVQPSVTPAPAVVTTPSAVATSTSSRVPTPATSATQQAAPTQQDSAALLQALFSTIMGKTIVTKARVENTDYSSDEDAAGATSSRVSAVPAVVTTPSAVVTSTSSRVVPAPAVVPTTPATGATAPAAVVTPAAVATMSSTAAPTTPAAVVTPAAVATTSSTAVPTAPAAVVTPAAVATMSSTAAPTTPAVVVTPAVVATTSSTAPAAVVTPAAVATMSSTAAPLVVAIPATGATSSTAAPAVVVTPAAVPTAPAGGAGIPIPVPPIVFRAPLTPAELARNAANIGDLETAIGLPHFDMAACTEALNNPNISNISQVSLDKIARLSAPNEKGKLITSSLHNQDGGLQLLRRGVITVADVTAINPDDKQKIATAVATTDVILKTQLMESDPEMKQYFNTASKNRR